MFANLLQLFQRREPASYERAFIKEVRIRRRVARNRRSEQLLAAGWLLIALKTWAMFWMVDAYHMPFNAWWIVAPTLVAAAVCTWVYVRRE